MLEACILRRLLEWLRIAALIEPWLLRRAWRHLSYSWMLSCRWSRLHGRRSMLLQTWLAVTASLERAILGNQRLLICGHRVATVLHWLILCPQSTFNAREI